MKFIIAYLFAIESAFAGLPPTTLKGQAETKAVGTTNYQVPNNGATTTGAGTRLIETGNTNVLANPGFEASPQLTGWTCANFSCVNNTLYFSDGKQGMTVSNANTVNSVVEQSVTPTFPTAGRAFQFGMFVNTNAVGFQVCSLFGGVEQGCADVPATSVTTFIPAPIFQPSTNGTVGVRLKSINTNAKQVFFDGGYVGAVPLSSGFSDSADKDYGPVTITSTGTAPTKGAVTVDHLVGRQVGSHFVGRYEFVTSGGGTDGTGFYIYTLPAAVGCTVPSNLVTFYSGTDISTDAAVVGSAKAGKPGAQIVSGATYMYSANSFRIGGGVSAGGANYQGVNQYGLSSANVFSATIDIPCAGWVPQTAINSQNSNYDWRPYVPATQGFTAAIATPYDCREKREGPDNIISCRFTASALTSSEARLGVPYVIDSTKNPNIALAGAITLTGAATGPTILREGGVTYLTFGYQNSTTGGLAKLSGTGALQNGAVFSVEARYPVAGWSENQNAPQLIGSVTLGPQATSGRAIRFFTQFGGTSAANVCTGTGVNCFTSNGTPNFTSVTSTGSGGVFNLVAPAGTCSTPILCSGAGANGSTGVVILTNGTPTNTLGQFVCVRSDTSAATSCFGNITCDCLQ